MVLLRNLSKWPKTAILMIKILRLALICRDCGWIIEGTSARPCVCQIREESNERRLPIPHLQQMLFSNFDLKLYPENIKTPNGNSYRQIAREGSFSCHGVC